MSDLGLHHVYAPPRTADGEPPPLLVLLHGVGSNEEDLFSLGSQLDPRFTVVSARAPFTRSTGSYAWFEVRAEGGEFVIHREMWERSLELLTTFLEQVPGVYGADAERVFVVGFSQGAIMGLCVMLTRPELAAGLVAMSGRLLPDVRALTRPPGDLEGFPMLLVHGAHDPVIPVRYAEEARVFLETLPVDLSFQVLPMAHQVTQDSLQLVDRWLRAQLDPIK